MAALLLVSCARGPAAEAVIAAPVVHEHTQREGNVVRYRLHGDEFLNHMRDVGGNLVAFGVDGDLYLADWISEREFNNASGVGEGGASGAPASSAVHARFTVPTGRKPAASAVGAQNAPSSEHTANSADTGIPKYLLDYARQKRAERDRARREQSGNAARNSTSSALHADPGNDTKVRNVLIIYANFTDQEGLTRFQNYIPTEQDIYNMIFDKSAFGSVAHYYKTVTGGMAEIVSAKESYGAADDGVVFVTLPGPHKAYGSNIDGEDGVKNKIIKPALAEAIINQKFADLADFDKNGDKVITGDELSIGVMVHGSEFSVGNRAVPNIWAHANAVPEDLLDGQGLGYEIKNYFTFGAFMNTATPPDLLTMGTIAHEMGHDAFGFLDVYDYGEEVNDGSVSAIGDWSLMGSGSWCKKSATEKFGSCPTPIDAYNLLYIKNPGVMKNDDASEENITLENPWDIMKLENGVKPKQYFLLQPRGYAGYDLGLLGWAAWGTPRSGLLIYHVDEAMDEIYSRPNDWNDHPLVDIEEAHGGTQHLQTSSYNSGEPNDLFYESQNNFSGATDPNSGLYDSDTGATQNRRSGVSVSNITSAITGEGTETGTFAATFDVAVAINTNTPSGGGGGEEEGEGGVCGAGAFAYAGMAGLIAIYTAKAVSHRKKR